MIEIQDIVFRREGAVILDGLSLRLDTPRVAFVGRNGSGKSTLLRLIAGLMVPQAGQIRVTGVDVARDRAGALATVGILFQNPDHQIIFPTVIEEICFGLEQQGHPRADARGLAHQALSRAGHPDWADRLCHTLSQGQRQMVCLLAILAMEPRWILFDEPFNSLDIPSILRVQAQIAALTQNVITITHDPARVADYDRVIWLEQGRIVGDGAPGDVLPAYMSAMEQAAREAPC
ncbi:MAG TPA: ABC transporter ATP-binding protein [Paenirhodobacter sp.]